MPSSSTKSTPKEVEMSSTINTQAREAIDAFTADGNNAHGTNSRQNSWRDAAMQATAERMITEVDMDEAVAKGLAVYTAVSGKEPPSWLRDVLESLAISILLKMRLGVNWLGYVTTTPAESSQRKADIEALLTRAYPEGREDLPALSSLCAVLSCNYVEGRTVEEQSRSLMIHYHAQCDFLGIPAPDRDEAVAIQAMKFWVYACQPS